MKYEHLSDEQREAQFRSQQQLIEGNHHNLTIQIELDKAAGNTEVAAQHAEQLAVYEKQLAALKRMQGVRKDEAL